MSGILHQFRRAPGRILASIFALALAARLLHLGQIRRAPFFDLMLGDAASYDAWARRVCHQMKTRTQINATLTRLKKPVNAFETTLGAAIATTAGQTPVRIQLPELEVIQVQTTVDIPTDCG